MPAPAVVPLALTAGKTAMQIWAALKGLSLGQLATGAFFGSEVLGQVGKWGERGLTKEQLALQTALAKSSAEIAKRGTKESRSAAEKYMQTLLKVKREEAKEERESMLMQSFMSSQDRQAAMLMQALQSMTALSPQTGVSPSAGMTALLRSNL